MARRRKRSAKIYVLPGVERRDMAGPPVESRRTLQAAIDNGVTDAIVVGRNRDGTLYLAGSPPDVDKAVGMLMRAVSVLSSCEIVNDVVIETEGK